MMGLSESNINFNSLSSFCHPRRTGTYLQRHETVLAHFRLHFGSGYTVHNQSPWMQHREQEIFGRCRPEYPYIYSQNRCANVCLEKHVAWPEVLRGSVFTNVHTPRQFAHTTVESSSQAFVQTKSSPSMYMYMQHTHTTPTLYVCILLLYMDCTHSFEAHTVSRNAFSLLHTTLALGR